MTKNLTINDFSLTEDNVKEIPFEENVVLVQETLPLAEKIAIIQDIVNDYVVAEEYYFNPLKLRTLAEIKTIQASTNIKIDEDDILNDVYALHDKLRKSGLLDLLKFTDYQEIVNWSYECAEVLCKFRSSFRGFLEEMKSASISSEDDVNSVMSIFEQIKNNPEISSILQAVATGEV
jgi:hypothetical protein